MYKLFIALMLLITQSLPASAADSFVALMYHRFGEDAYPSTSIRIDQFKAHLEYLKTGGYQVIDIAQAHDFLENGTELPEKAVLITIDDAYLSTYTTAYPLFQEYGFPFTVFVATNSVDEGLSGYMSWQQMREMASGGATFANHGATHDSLLYRHAAENEATWLSRIEADISKSAQRLAEELNPFTAAFAYPYGEYDEKSAQVLLDAGYVSYGQQSGATGLLSDKRSLPRFPINEAHGEISDFRTKVASIPLPVISLTPWDPFTQDRRPQIEIELGETDDRISELACYVSGQGRVEIDWLIPGKKFRVAPIADLPHGRNRVNCTAPTNSGRYRWFSHPWVIVEPENTFNQLLNK